MIETKTFTCERGDDLISFLYGEATEHEATEFEKHLRICPHCQSEINSFSKVRDSIGIWKETTLGGFVAPQVFATARNKSALGAIKSFFDLSPVWLKGAIGFATVVFCLLLGLTLRRTGNEAVQQTATSGPIYTQQQLNEKVAEALKNQAAQFATTTSRETQNVAAAGNAPRPRQNKQTPKSVEWARVRRPLSRSERQQLASDLRLLSSKEEDTLNLLGDRINQEF
jgi:hypothetical protein